MNDRITPSIGRIVEYTLTESIADQINRRRKDAQDNMTEHRRTASGVQVHVGNEVKAGEAYPLVITRVWGDSPNSVVNGQLLLDGNDTLWLTSVGQYEDARSDSERDPNSSDHIPPRIHKGTWRVFPRV